MASYNGSATLTAGDLRIEVMTHVQSGVDAHGRAWWRGTYTTTDEGAAWQLDQFGEATIELLDEGDNGRVRMADFGTQLRGTATGRFIGAGSPPRSLR